MRNYRTSLLLASLVAACAGSAQKPSGPALPPVGETAQPPPDDKQAPPAPPPVATVDATPDVPKGADAARDAELAKAATAVVETFTNVAPVLSRDGKKVVFTSDRDGLPQLYVADASKPDSAATRLVTTSERIFGALPLPDGKSLIYASDHGADENFSYFRVGFDGKDPVELTPGAKLRRDDAIVPDGKPDTMFYSARAMSDVGTTVYSASALAPGEEKVLYKDDKPGNLVDVSQDGKWGLFLRFPSRSEMYLVVLDLGKGSARQIYPASGKVSISQAAFSADGKRVLLGTDAGAEQALLLSLDVTTGKETARYVETKPATAEISGLAVAKKGGLLAVAFNAGNHSEVRLLDAATLKPKATVTQPLGSGFVTSFSEDGKRVTLQWSTPDAPGDIYAIDARTGKVTPLRKEARPQLDALPKIEASITEVDAFDGGKIPVNVYLPAGTSKAKDKKLPVIVSYHGGPSGSSAIRWSAVARFFVGQGYAWVEPNVRGSSGFGRAYEEADNGPKRFDAFKDIESTGRWAASQPWADKDRVVVFGGSYGGYTVLVALSHQPDLWRAGVDLFGVANLKTFMATTSGIIHELFLTEFGDPDKDGAFLDSISPLKDAAKIVDPLFVYAGANDPRVPRSESDLIVKALRARKVPVEYMVKDNEGHSLAHKENQVELYSRAARFLEQHLK